MPIGIDEDCPLIPSMIGMFTSSLIWASFVSYLKLKGTSTMQVQVSMVGYGKHNTILQQESFWGLCDASGPLDVPLKKD